MQKRPRTRVDVNNGFGEWGGYMDAKKSKLEEQFAADAIKNPYKQSNLFAGISIFVNGLTSPSAEELKHIMMTHGGVFHTYQKSTTNFIIASNLPDVKIRQITTAKIISPKWIVDCISANKILDYSNYLLYTNCRISQPKITFNKKHDEEKATHDELYVKENINKQQTKQDILMNLDILNSAIRHNVIENTSQLQTHDISIKNDMGHDKKAKTAVDPNFIKEFYNNSRLHHIATLGASFKQHILQIRKSHSGKFPELEKLKGTLPLSENDFSKNIIMHIDMDCFFVSVGLRTRPHLKGFPIAVTHSKGYNGNNLKNGTGVDRKKEMELYVKRHEEKYMQIDSSDDRIKTMPLIDNTISLSEIASCSYEARKDGVKNGMFVGAALKLCPQLKTIPYDFEAYKETAYILYNTITKYTIDVEAVSCDEMYVNLTSILKTLKCSVNDFVSYIRAEIIEKTQCPCSAGIGENKLQARMATKKAKPNGQFYLKSEKVEEFFKDVTISDLPGVGQSIWQRCSNIGLASCADLQKISLQKLQQEFGKKLSETLYQYCRGLDNKPLTYDHIRKSVSAEINYGIRFTTEKEVESFLCQLCAEVHTRLTEISAKGKTITLKFMVRAKEAPKETAKYLGHGFCDNLTKSMTLSTFTSDIAVISETVFNIKNQLNIPPSDMRGIGIQISKLNNSGHDVNRKNSLKDLFAKAQNQQVLDTAPSNGEHINLNACAKQCNSDSKSVLRKMKCFNGCDEIQKSNIKDVNRDINKTRYNELDLMVLAEFPKEIQEQILLEDNQQNGQRPKMTKKSFARKLENDFNDENDSHKFQIHQKYISKENIFNSIEWRQIISNWIDNNVHPTDFDIEAIVYFFKEFTYAHKVREVSVALKFLHRKAEKLDCRWHEIYNTIVDEVQNEIKTAFAPNITLCTKVSFDCKNCINKIE